MLTFAPTPAQAVGFEVSYVIDGDPNTVTVQVDPNGIGFVEAFQQTTAEYQITINALLDPDPKIIYAVSIIDFGAASTFGFAFQSPVAPALAAPGSVSHQHSSSTTDGGAPPGTSVTALAPPAGIPVDLDAIAEIAVYTLSLTGDPNWISAGHDLSPSFVGDPNGDVQGSFLESGPGPAGAGSYDAMRVDVNFSMTGNSDAYTFNGTATLIPEPGTIGLTALGLAALLALRARRRV